MTIILDTNIVISALIRNSVVRKILLLPTLDFLLPEFAIEEIYHHKSKICKLSRIDKEELELLISLILQNVNVISSDEILPYYDKAVKIIGEIDMKREDEENTYETQSHGGRSLWLKDPNNSSYANAYKTFTNSANEYMVEFYLWIYHSHASIDSFPLCVLWNMPGRVA